MAINKDYKEGYLKALEDIFNTNTDEALGTLRECYTRETKGDYDEGWDKCFEALVDVVCILKEQTNE